MNKVLFLLVFFLISFCNVKSEKAWTIKHYYPSEELFYFSQDTIGNCYAFATKYSDQYRSYFTIIYKSSDSGNTWDTHYEHIIEESDSVYKINKCFMYNNNFYIDFMDEVLIEMSTDGGKTFVRKEFDLSGKIEDEHIRDINMYNDSIGVVCTTDRLLITHNNWTTYKTVNLGEHKWVGQPSFFLDSDNIAYISKQALSNNFLKFNMTNESWTMMNEPDTTGGKYKRAMYDVWFVDDSVGFACGAQNYGVGSFSYDVIWKTTDKGYNWTVIFYNKIPSTFAPREISFDSPLHGFAAGSWGKLLETTDGGDSWHYLEPDKYLENNVIYAVFTINGYNIISIPSAILRYEDVTSSIEEAPEVFTVYPVPAPSGGALHIALGTQISGTADISIYDLRGTRISTLFTGELSSPDITVTLPALPSGPYFIAVTTPAGVYRRKMVVQ